MTDPKPYNPDAAIAKIEDPLQRTIANELRDLGYTAMIDHATRLAATLRDEGLAP